MFLTLLNFCMEHLVYFALHVLGGNSFPKPLTAEEEKRCLEQMAAGSEEARKTLIAHNLRLVAHIVKKYYSSGCEQDDLISIGTIGLIKGINSFNAGKNIRLSTYASRCIENEILMSFRTGRKSAQDLFISDPIDTDREGNTLTLQDIIAEDDTLVEDLDLKLKAERLGECMDLALSPREREIIEERYGLNGREEHTQNQIARRLHISRSYVSRIEKRALERLRACFEKKKT